jgi:hypothetical protein
LQNGFGKPAAVEIIVEVNEAWLPELFFRFRFLRAYGISIDAKPVSSCLKIFHRDKNVDQYQIVLIQNNDRIRYKLIFYISRRKT